MYPDPSGTAPYSYPWYDQPTDYNFQYNWWWTCPHCNSAISWWSQYCPFCGKQLSVKPTQEQTMKEIKELLEKIMEKFNSLSETKIEEES